MTVEKKSLSFDDLYIKYPLTMTDMPPDDLEPVCARTPRKHELLVAESGFQEGKYGRAFPMHLKEKKDKWKGGSLDRFSSPL